MPPSGGSGSRSARQFVRRARVLAGLASVCPVAAWACPCGPGAAPVSTVSVAGERVAVRAALTGLFEAASWDERGDARLAPAGALSARALFEAAAAWRPRPSLELSLLGGFGAAWVELPGVSARALRMGDLSGRVRWEPIDTGRWRVAGFFTARAPTGDVAEGALANGLASLGLGVWEFAPGLEVAARDDDRGTVGIALDVGLRTARGGWRPGARITATAFGAWRCDARWTLTGSVSHLLELSSERDGRAVPDSATRRLSVGAGVAWRADDALTASLGVAIDPWASQLGANAIASARLTLGVTWAR